MDRLPPRPVAELVGSVAQLLRRSLDCKNLSKGLTLGAGLMMVAGLACVFAALWLVGPD